MGEQGSQSGLRSGAIEYTHRWVAIARLEELETGLEELKRVRGTLRLMLGIPQSYPAVGSDDLLAHLARELLRRSEPQKVEVVIQGEAKR